MMMIGILIKIIRVIPLNIKINPIPRKSPINMILFYNYLNSILNLNSIYFLYKNKINSQNINLINEFNNHKINENNENILYSFKDCMCYKNSITSFNNNINNIIKNLK